MPEARHRRAETSLQSYSKLLELLASGRSRKGLAFFKALPAIERLLQTMTAVAPASPGASNEEWNPLSQRPHAPLTPDIGDELGAEITAKKEAVFAFTTLCHEMLHVAVWEPFFAGSWRPASELEFREFSLRAEGYCFFFSDIVLTGVVRERLADGEFALERQTPSSVLFAPVRAFNALGLTSESEILEIYLEAFNGQRTKLWQPRGKNDFAAALATRTFEFYSQSTGYLTELHSCLVSMGLFEEFWERFCAIKGLPAITSEAPAGDLREYFKSFHRKSLPQVSRMTTKEARDVRLRRAVQMRAYFTMQVRSVIARRRYFGKLEHAAVLRSVDSYLEGMARVLRTGSAKEIPALDAAYNTSVRARLQRSDAWVGERSMILPRRAGGALSVFDRPQSGRAAKVRRIMAVTFLLDELTKQLKSCKTVEEREEVLAEIECISALGRGKGRLSTALKRPLIRKLWSVPLCAVDPASNSFRELLFSYA